MSEGIVYLPSDRAYLLKKPLVEGNLNDDISYFQNMGLQGTKLYESYKIIKQAREAGFLIVLAFTANAATSGLREVIAEMTKKKIIDVLVTTGGGIEQDIIKIKNSFKYVLEPPSDLFLLEKGIQRTGNILCPNDGYVWFEKFLQECGEKIDGFYQTDPFEIVKNMQKVMPYDEKSFVYQAKKNDVPIFPICIEDGAIGDHYAIKQYRMKNKQKNLPVINSASNIRNYLNYLLQKQKKVCTVILGGGPCKHYVLNACIPIGGSDTTIYYNNQIPYDGSNAGATVQESLSWKKSKPKGAHLKVYGDFLFTFSLVARQLIKDETEKNANTDI